MWLVTGFVNDFYSITWVIMKFIKNSDQQKLYLFNDTLSEHRFFFTEWVVIKKLEKYIFLLRLAEAVVYSWRKT